MIGEIVRKGDAFWPGVDQVISCHYTMAHGISPGVAVIMMLPQSYLPTQSGDLVITDGVTTITIPDCRVESLRVNKDSSGERWILTIKDRRWRWRDTGFIKGRYNVVDPNGQYAKLTPEEEQEDFAKPTKYIPWTLKTPFELAVLCLEAMNETNYVVNMPDDFFSIPQVNWDHINPAQALQTLCSQFNRRIIYRIDTNTVLIDEYGKGSDLTGGIFESSYSKDSPVVSNLQRPDSIVLIGAPERYQILLDLVAVGEEWDGSIRPIDLLSYAPEVNSDPQVTNIAVSNPQTGAIYTLSFLIQLSNAEQQFRELQFVVTAADNTLATLYAQMAAAISGDVIMVRNGFKAVAVSIAGLTGGTQFVLQITGNPNADPFGLIVTVKPAVGSTLLPIVSTWTSNVPTAKYANGEYALWSLAGAPSFANVQATSRLTKEQAVALAQKSVFKWYQVTANDPGTGDYPYEVPNFGPVTKREQFLIQDTKVDPIVPEPGDKDLIVQKGEFAGEPFMQSIYNGTFKLKPATCYGVYNQSVLDSVGLTFTKNQSQRNTSRTTLVPIPFTIDKFTQTVRFNDFVCQWYTPQADIYSSKEVSYQFPADIVLETAVQILDPDNNQVTRFMKTLVLPDGDPTTPPLFIRREDVQANYIGIYDYNLRTFLTTDDDTEYAETAADYYLETAAAPYIDANLGRNREWNGIVPVVLDASIAQITWEVGERGARTQASTNSEHSVYFPSYPERLRLEYIRPVVREVNENDAAKIPPFSEPKVS
jgi:hypothetical protein